jgi:ribosomal protein S26
MAAEKYYFTGMCKEFTEGRCRFAKRCHYRHDRAFQGRAALLGPLINTKQDSEHHVNFHCAQCGKVVASEKGIYRVNNNALWVYADRVPADTLRHAKAPILNNYKTSLSYCVFCCGCDAYLGWYYPKQDDRRLYKLVYITKGGKFNVMYLSKPSAEVNASHTPLHGTVTQPHPRAWTSEKRDLERRVGEATLGHDPTTAEMEAIRIALENNLRLHEGVSARALIEEQQKLTAEVEGLREQQQRVEVELDQSKQQLEDLTDEFTCCICMENRFDTSLNCGHVFCKTCIDAFPKALCPNCREPIVSEKLLFF